MDWKPLEWRRSPILLAWDGAGQFRRIRSHTLTQKFELDQPFLVQPDAKIWKISVTTVRHHLYFINNEAVDVVVLSVVWLCTELCDFRYDRHDDTGVTGIVTKEDRCCIGETAWVVSISSIAVLRRVITVIGSVLMTEAFRSPKYKSNRQRRNWYEHRHCYQEECA